MIVIFSLGGVMMALMAILVAYADHDPDAPAVLGLGALLTACCLVVSAVTIRKRPARHLHALLAGDGSHQFPGPGAEPGSSRRGVLVVVGLLLLAAVTAVIAISSSSTSTLQLTADQLRAGDCLRGPDLGLGTSSPWPDTVAVVPCNRPHLAAVTGIPWR